MQRFDFIIVGGGASGLLLAEAMGNDPWFSGKRLALIEQEPSKGNDRTWCFWEAGDGPFDAITHRQWDRLYFRDASSESRQSIAPFRYKMLRGADFYREWYGRVRNLPNIELIEATVEALEEGEGGARVITSAGTYFAPRVFSSVIFGNLSDLMRPYPVLKQHFIGWRVKTSRPVFDALTPTFMDFSVPQEGNTRFMYVLPFGPDEALVEYTLFSGSLLADAEYEAAIADYLEELLGGDAYEVLEREKGTIPMTCNDFSAADSSHITHIGIAGGWAKPSTGYTFWSSAQKTARLVAAVKTGGSLRMARKDRFWFYDLVMLEVLYRRNASGSHIFSGMFRKLPPTLILRFLHEQTTLREDLRVIGACPKAMFLGGLWRTFLKSLS